MVKPFKFRHSSRIARRLAIYVILASSIITIFTTSFQLYGLYNQDVSDIELRLNDIRDSYSDHIAHRVWIANQQELKVAITGVLRLPDIEYIEIHENGRLTLSEGLLPEGDVIEREIPLYYVFHNKKQEIGKMYIVASLESTYQHLIDQSIKIIVSNGIKTFLISGFMLFLFYNLVARHLQKITEYALNINVYNLDDRLTLDRAEHNKSEADEFDILVDAVHSMQLNLKTSISQVSLSEKNLLLTINSLSDAVLRIDERGVVISVNNTTEKLFGYMSEEIIGQNINLLIPKSDIYMHGDYVKECIYIDKNILIGFGREVFGKNKNENVFPIRMSITELPLDDSGMRYFVCSCQDLTLLKQQEEQLRRSQKMDALGELTGGIAHDYNNLLGVILGYSELIMINVENDLTLVGYVEQIIEAGERGASLSKKILNFSKYEEDYTSIVDLNELLSAQEDLLRKLLTVRINLLIVLGEDIWPVLINDNDLKDVILNLSINAMHSMEDMGSEKILEIKSSNIVLNRFDALSLNIKEGDYVRLSISDTGTGMDDVVKEKMFDPLFTTKGEKGTGLGLSQVYNFINRIGGAIKVYTEISKGTDIILYIPRYMDGISDRQNVADANAIDFSGSEKILIVDDESSLCDLCTTLLEEIGYETLKASSAKQALDILSRETFDLLLSDVIMPEMDGYQLSEIVQKKYPSMKIQLVSGFSDQNNRNIVDDVLHKNIIYKPYKSETLFQKIRVLLDEKQV